MSRRARSNLARDKRAITTDSFPVFLSTMSVPLSQPQLLHEAEPEDYVWSAADCQWRCSVCYKVATDDHCRSEGHARRIQWYGAAAKRREQQQLQPVVSGLGVPAMTGQPPAFCMEHYEVPSMYVFSVHSSNWYCKVCGATATEGHCVSAKHQKGVIHNLNKYRHPSSRSDLHALSSSRIDFNDLNDPLERWGRHVICWGLDIERVTSSFKAPGSSTPAHIVEFTFSNCAPSWDQTISFWGEVYGFVRMTIEELLKEGGELRDLWYFHNDRTKWYSANVWSDCDKRTTSTKKNEQEPGLWWPCLAVDIGDGKVVTYCQDFALRKARKAWEADESRVEACTPPLPQPCPHGRTCALLCPECLANRRDAATNGDDGAANGDDDSEDSSSESEWQVEPREPFLLQPHDMLEPN